MTSTVVRNFDFLKKLCKSRNCKSLLRNASKNNVKALCEVCLNFLKGNIAVDEKTKSKLKKHRKCIEFLSKRRVSLRTKKKFLVDQRGGFMGLLASIALPLISGLVARAFDKKRKK
jgi:hypothetical protein